jgi:hypothetical protein
MLGTVQPPQRLIIEWLWDVGKTARLMKPHQDLKEGQDATSSADHLPSFERRRFSNHQMLFKA